MGVMCYAVKGAWNAIGVFLIQKQIFAVWLQQKIVSPCDDPPAHRICAGRRCMRSSVAGTEEAGEKEAALSRTNRNLTY